VLVTELHLPQVVEIDTKKGSGVVLTSLPYLLSVIQSVGLA
jgi:hypothetical protein